MNKIEETLLNSFNKDEMELSFNGEVVNDYKILKVLDDITRQALIPYFSEVLYNAGYRKADDIMQTYKELNESVTRLQLEAIKKFAEKLKDKFNGYEATSYNGYEEGWHDLQEEINDLLKEYEEK